MVGRSNRFRISGYKKPKFMLPILDGYVFDYSVKSFKSYFHTEEFLFILLNDENEIDFVKNRISYLGIKKWSIVTLDYITNGQAETVFKGVIKNKVDENTSLTIFNIDTFKSDYIFPNFIFSQDVDGYLETFIGCGNNWSYVEPNLLSRYSEVIRTEEKKQISNLACSGLYYFKNISLFNQAYKLEERKFFAKEIKEIYIAPIYNYLINKGLDIRFTITPKEDLLFCGIPKEYEEIKKLIQIEKRFF